MNEKKAVYRHGEDPRLNLDNYRIYQQCTILGHLA